MLVAAVRQAGRAGTEIDRVEGQLRGRQHSRRDGPRALRPRGGAHAGTALARGRGPGQRAAPGHDGARGDPPAGGGVERAAARHGVRRPGRGPVRRPRGPVGRPAHHLHGRGGAARRPHPPGGGAGGRLRRDRLHGRGRRRAARPACVVPGLRRRGAGRRTRARVDRARRAVGLPRRAVGAAERAVRAARPAHPSVGGAQRPGRRGRAHRRARGSAARAARRVRAPGAGRDRRGRRAGARLAEHRRHRAAGAARDAGLPTGTVARRVQRRSG